MQAPRLEIDLNKIYYNAKTLVNCLEDCGISVTGVTKVSLGNDEIATTLLEAGVKRLGDSRIENIEAMRRAHVVAPMMLIRSPMLSQIPRVVEHADISFNTEIEIIRALSVEAQKKGRNHGIVLMVELGDLREGIMPDDLLAVVGETLRMPHLTLKGIGTNLACRSGVAPDSEKMTALSRLATLVETTFSLSLEIVSGGNSANLEWAMSGAAVNRINDLRLGESVLLGCDTLSRKPIRGLYTDAITLHAEVIEEKVKPSMPVGRVGMTAFGKPPLTPDRGLVTQSILAIGQQDTDPQGLHPPDQILVKGASSDHLILESNRLARLSVGMEVCFQLNYSALMRAMTSPFVYKQVKPRYIFNPSSFRVSTSSLDNAVVVT